MKHGLLVNFAPNMNEDVVVTPGYIVQSAPNFSSLIHIFMLILSQGPRATFVQQEVSHR